MSNPTPGADKNLFANAYLLLILAPLFWGANAVAGKMSSAEWQPFTLTALRWALVCLVLLPFGYQHLRRDWQKIREHIGVFIFLGAVSQAGFNLCMYLALHFTSAINVSIEQASMPIFIMVLNYLFFRQRVFALQLVGLLLTLVGVLLTATYGKPLAFFEGGWNRGDLLMLVACVFYAAYSFGLRWRPSVHWVTFLIVMGFFACMGSIPWAVLELATRPFEPPSSEGLYLLAFIVVFPSILGQLFFARGVDLIGANRAGLFINMVPVFGALLAVIVLGEQFRWFHYCGLLLVLGGVLLAEFSARRGAVGH